MRFAANLLFQYRVSKPVRKRRMAESQIVVLRARDAESALRKALKIGRREQVQYKNVFGGTVSIEFLGLIDLLDLDPTCGPDEVWYRMFYSANPRKYLTPTRRLSAFASWSGAKIGDAIWAAPAAGGKSQNAKHRSRPNRRRAVA